MTRRSQRADRQANERSYAVAHRQLPTPPHRADEDADEIRRQHRAERQLAGAKIER
jgi:hypothetical protein